MLNYEFKRSSCRRILREYCTENFIYAVRLLADRQLLKFEKLWWFLWIVAAFTASCYAVKQLYHKWDENPVVNVYAPRLESISSVPFPAVTICPLSKTRQDVFNVTEAYELVRNGTSLGSESDGMLRALAHVCSFSHHWKKFDHRDDETVLQTLRKLAFRTETLIQWCMWRYKSVNCSEMISKTLTEDGICYTFNALPADQLYRSGVISPEFLSFKTTSVANWTQDSGYSWDAGPNVYPHRPIGSGIKSGLYLLLSMRKIDQELWCRGPHTGYKIMVHPPDEVAVSSELYFRLSIEDAVGVTVTPNVMYTSQSLRHISPLRRRCFFDNERYLRFFKVYNQLNCAIECMTNMTLRKCGCVKFSMPRTADTPVCDASKIGCFRNILKEVFDSQLRMEKTRSITSCGCFPACNSVQYQVQSTRFPFYVEKYRQAAGTVFEKYNDYDLSVMSVSFKDNHYLPIWRRELYGTTDVIAKFGGLFALLLGASAMSLSEIIYYSCIRPLRRERIPRLAVNWMFVLPWVCRERNPFRVPRNY
ncbi:pickpocket protein 28-like [Culex pipiens pallens]|nr:pickpocket protein 28-like [Culex pipiens pallens]